MHFGNHIDFCVENRLPPQPVRGKHVRFAAFDVPPSGQIGGTTEKIPEEEAGLLQWVEQTPKKDPKRFPNDGFEGIKGENAENDEALHSEGNNVP